MFCYIMWLVPPYHFVTGMTAKYVWFKLNCLTRHTVISLLSKLLLHFLCNLNDIWRLWLTWRVISQNTFSVPSYSRISFLLQLGRHFTYAIFVKFLCVRPRFHAQFYKKTDNNCIWSNNISVVIAKEHSYVMHGPTGQKDERCVTTLRLHIYQVS